MIGIILDKYHLKNNYVKYYTEILKYNKVPFFLIDSNSIQFENQIKKVDYIIFRWGHYDTDRQLAQTLMPLLEFNLNKSCFPNYNTSWHYDDKIRQYYLMQSNNFPYIQSYIFWDKIKAQKWAEDSDLPVVHKLKGGAGSKNVHLIKSRRKLKSIINKSFSKGFIPNEIDRGKFSIIMEIRHLIAKSVRYLQGKDSRDTWQKEKNYVLFQKYLANNEYDLRVTTIGGRGFAFKRYTRKDDFRASGSGKIDYNISHKDMDCVKMAIEMSKSMKFQTMAYDFMYNENMEPEFCEISYTYEDKAVYNCKGYWDENMVWHKGHFLPEYLHLMDLLNKKDLKQPNFKFLLNKNE